MAVTQYFLGGNTVRGFVSFYSGFCRGPEDFLWVIKGGPGCGKSSFMKTIGRAAEEKGLDVEYVLCSGDPESVDGVYFPALHTGYADGTAPHVLEAVTPDVPEYTKARRLLDFCQYFLDLPDEDDVPNNSILREFIGKSVFFKGEDQV